MEEVVIGLVLARATELQKNISNCIHISSSSNNPQAEDDIDDDEDEDYEEAESLFNIHDALDALETQLAILQNLQQQQQYDRDAAHADIESSCKMLVDKLKEYKGKNLDVLQDTSAFASATVEHYDDLLLPPYPIRPLHSMVLVNGYVSTPMCKSLRNGSNCSIAEEAKKYFAESDKNQTQNRPTQSRKFFRRFIGETLKTALTLVGVLSVLTLTSFGPKFPMGEAAFNILGMFQQSSNKEKRSSLCPAGNILVVENGEARCLVRVRVEIPFDSVVSAPDVNYGCG